LLGSELLARSLASCRLTSGLLSTSHLMDCGVCRLELEI
jgi:hypothetical protein